MDFFKANFLQNQTVYSFYQQKLIQSRTSSLNVKDTTAQIKNKTSQHQQKLESMPNETLY